MIDLRLRRSFVRLCLATSLLVIGVGDAHAQAAPKDFPQATWKTQPNSEIKLTVRGDGGVLAVRGGCQIQIQLVSQPSKGTANWNLVDRSNDSACRVYNGGMMSLTWKGNGSGLDAILVVMDSKNVRQTANVYRSGN